VLPKGHVLQNLQLIIPISRSAHLVFRLPNWATGIPGSMGRV
jgi:hypothetical protein